MSHFTIRRQFLLLSILALSFASAGCSDSDSKDISALTAQVTAHDSELSANREQLGEISTRLDGSDSRLSELSQRIAALEAAKAEAASELTKAQDLAALSAVAGCYGRGHDAVVPAKDGDQSAALAILSNCFADDVQSEFIYFDNPVQPADQLDGLPALTNYIGSFWFNAGYHSARNTPGNVHVELVDARHATLLYSGTTPHFSLAGADSDPDPQNVSRPGFIDNISASYTSDLERDDDGVWRTTHFTINIKEVIRVAGTYWIAQ
jgi:hypothetical protein